MGEYIDDIRGVIEDEYGGIYSLDRKRLLKFEGEYLDTYKIKEGTVSIGNRAFLDCKSLKQIIIPESVKKIGKNAFENCSNLQQVTIPKSVVCIGHSAFSGCQSLKKIKIPSIKKIENNCF